MTLYLFCATLFLFTNSNLNNDKYIIIPNKGIDSIIIGKSTLKEVQQEFGVKKIKRKWHKAIEVDCFGKFEYYIKYDSIATFSTITKNRNKEVVYKIILESGSKCKTKGGNGIGSSYENIINEFGRPESLYFFKDENRYKTELSYGDMDIILNSKDTLSNSVCEIIIW